MNTKLPPQSWPWPLSGHKTAGDLTPAELNSLQQALRDTRDAAHLLSGYYDTPRQDIGLTMQGIHARRTRDDH